jgi:hypothetical protein
MLPSQVLRDKDRFFLTLYFRPSGLQVEILLPGIRIGPISLRSGYFYIAEASAANGNPMECERPVNYCLREEWKIIIYLNARAIVHSEVN